MAMRASVRRDHHMQRYRAQGNSPAEEIWVALWRQSFDAAAGPEVDAVHGTRDFSHRCSGRMCKKPR